MAVGDDFVGRACPMCGALDSLQTDESRGEVACTNCAKVVAMGLEESIATRYNADATYDDVDRHAGEGGGTLGALNASRTLSRTAAAALAAGQASHMSSGNGALAAGDGKSRLAQYARTPLHPRMRQYMENLVRIARRGAATQSLSHITSSSSSGNAVLERALEIARIYVGRRRERRERLEHQNDVAAVCVMLAAEMHQQPIPLAELFVLDASVRKVQEMRPLVVSEAMLEQEERQLQRVFALHLLRYYLRLLHVQRSRFEEPCQVMLHTLRRIGREDYDWTRLVESDRVALAVLLVCTRTTCAPEGECSNDSHRPCEHVGETHEGEGGGRRGGRGLWAAAAMSVQAGVSRHGQRYGLQHPDSASDEEEEEEDYLDSHRGSGDNYHHNMGSSSSSSRAKMKKRDERAVATVMARFAAGAHLNPIRLSKLMQLADRHMDEIVPLYRQQLRAVALAQSTTAESNMGDCSAQSAIATRTSIAQAETERVRPDAKEQAVGVKRERGEDGG